LNHRQSCYPWKLSQRGDITFNFLYSDNNEKHTKYKSIFHNKPNTNALLNLRVKNINSSPLKWFYRRWLLSTQFYRQKRCAASTVGVMRGRVSFACCRCRCTTPNAFDSVFHDQQKVNKANSFSTFCRLSNQFIYLLCNLWITVPPFMTSNTKKGKEYWILRHVTQNTSN